jgi:glycosyltransferase involved in cell wall biosynthesis
MEAMCPKVSVLMLTYNRPQFIDMAIESIRAQCFPDWELLVVHDGPNERIPVVMEEWRKRDNRIRYFRRATPGNIAEATNFGLSRANGEYIAVLDDDDYWVSPEKLSRQIRFLDDHRDYACCGGGVIVIDPEGREQMRYLKPSAHERIRRRALIANPMAHSSTMFRRGAALRVGGYDESLAGFQDWDLWLKLGKAGKLYNFLDYFLCYRIWQGSGSFQQSKGNTASALRIIHSHRHDYPGFSVAYAMAMLYYGYARLPLGVHRLSYSMVSRMKKAVFSHSASRMPVNPGFSASPAPTVLSAGNPEFALPPRESKTAASSPTTASVSNPAR